MKFVVQREIDQAEQDAATVARLRAALDSYWTSHGAGAMVAVSHMRDLLNPRGMWSLTPSPAYPKREHVQTAESPAQEADPALDPMTGCRPVTSRA